MVPSLAQSQVVTRVVPSIRTTAGRRLGGIGKVSGQDLLHHRQQGRPPPGDSRLEDAEQIGGRLLDQVLPQQEQHQHHRLVQPHRPHPPRHHGRVWIPHAHLMDPYDQPIR